ncbi:MAG: hypothetical protein HS115_13765 [Spirochaetales bacterium]|nr:hypothetical protein [Spirochaetales bacterium]
MAGEIWVVSAFLPEQEEVRSLEGQQILSDGLPFVLRFHLCGVGNIAAATALCRLLERSEGACAEILFLGSAGAYSGGSREAILATVFGQKELAVLQGRAVPPDLMPTHFTTGPGPLARSLFLSGNFSSGKVNSPGAVSLVDPGAGEWTHENLECAGLAYVASLYQLPFAALLAVTNSVGPQGSAEWKGNYKEQGGTLQRCLKKHILEEVIG